jgi:uncharacterized heparinase superfamily protein
MTVGEWAASASEDERRWRERLVDQADRIARHQLSFFDLVDRHLGDPIDWNRDHASGVKAPLWFASFIDYRDHRVTGDAKLVWEPNRHHQFVVLGRAYRATGDIAYAAALVEQLGTWIRQCPFGRGMNWRSPLELAIRLINWVWAVDLILESGLVQGAFHDTLRRVVYLHLRAITRKYSRGSSANNHRIGEAAGVFIGASYFPDLDQGGRWRRGSQRILAEEIIAQTYPDGGSREQAVGYQFFVLHFFVLAGIVARATGQDFPEAYWKRLELMIEFLGALSEGAGAPPMIGDSDDGYVFDLGDSRDLAGVFCIGAVLFHRKDFKAWGGRYAESSRWLLGRHSHREFDALSPVAADGPLVSRALPESGYFLLQCGHQGQLDRISVVFDGGELGYGPIAAHGHADALSFSLRAFGRDVLVDPGTFDYFTFPAWRDYFRSTKAHNTLAVDGLDQSVMRGPFAWGSRARTRCASWEPGFEGGRVVGIHDGYTRLADPVVHTRTLDLDPCARILTVRDDVAASGTHEIAVYFHLSEDAKVLPEEGNRFKIWVPGGTVTLEVDTRLAVEIVEAPEQPIGGWVSRGYHRKSPSTTLVARARCSGNDSFICRALIAPVRRG